ncbi:MAG: trehalose 6-phosphate synthase [Chloroflexota bacterium]|jgi:trehalose 6-phosphate synthase|nr:trehalose 6-phosphate synthase [Chloroflexota bacterium]
MEAGYREVGGDTARLSAFNLAGREVIVASHRGPVEFRITDDGNLIGERGCGGLTTALSALASEVPFTWVSAAMTHGDRRAADLQPVESVRDPIRTQFVVVPPSVYDAHYSQFCNPLLWFVQHGLGTSVAQRFPADRVWDAWTSGYHPMNRAFADAVARAARTPDPVVLLQDYQLYLAPRMLCDQLPGATILHFSHIPWPAPEAWEAVPLSITQRILKGLLGADILGFQDGRSADRFLQACHTYGVGGFVDTSARIVRQSTHDTQVRVYPISIDPGVVKAALESPEGRRYRAELADERCDTTIVRVDRLDPTKNIPLGFDAFERLLVRRPDLVGRARFLAFLVPSRTGIPEYQATRAVVFAAAERINARFGGPGYRPVEISYENNWVRALAGMSLADVVLVNPIADGMNLVAKEACAVSQREAMLVLSKEAGAWAELGGAALGIDPFDVQQTTRALEVAIDTPRGERAVRAAELRRRVEAHDIWDWLRDQCADLAALAERGSPGTAALTPA